MIKIEKLEKKRIEVSFANKSMISKQILSS